MLREISRYIIENYNSLTDDEIDQLETVNNLLSGIIFELEEEELDALSRI